MAQGRPGIGRCVKTFCRAFERYEIISRKMVENIRSMMGIALLSIEYIKALASFPIIRKVFLWYVGYIQAI